MTRITRLAVAVPIALAALLTTVVLGGSAVPVVSAAGAAEAAGAASAADVPRAEGTWRPPGHTIVRVTGDAANGFTVHRYDGTALHPPTDSEAMAECSEHDGRVERVRCRTEVRVWYRDLADTKRAIAWARHDARR